MKKFILLLLLFVLLFLNSCSVNTNKEVIENKSYIMDEFTFYDNIIINIDTEKIKDGKLFIPKYINNCEVYGIGDGFVPIITTLYDLLIIDGKKGIETIFFNEYMTFLNPPSIIKKNDNYYRYVVEDVKNIYLVCNNFTHCEVTDIYAFTNFLKYKNAENIYISKEYFDLWLNNGNYIISDNEFYNIYYNDDYTINIYSKNSEKDEQLVVKAANISYMYNYDNSPNNDYYFIFNSENGKVIEPKYSPVREGYEFLGWYKEKECINEWIFDEDYFFEKEGENYEEYKLFAKWRKYE